jgi:hypothetical protein
MNFSITSGGGGVECPRCRRSMTRLEREAGPRHEGYIASNDRPSGLIVFLFGRLCALLAHYVFVPAGSALFGNLKIAGRQRILREYPNSLICTHCGHIVKRK